MRRSIIIGVTASFASLFLYAFNVLAQETKVQILDPARAGTEVRRTYIIRGIASIPSGTHLWVLSRREDFEGVWWPQGEGRADPTSGEWKVSVTFGVQDDIGWNFDIAVIVVPEQNHIILRDYRTNAMKTNDWRPIELPQVVAPPVLLKVKKVGH
jgi:hypothetical protein